MFAFFRKIAVMMKSLLCWFVSSGPWGGELISEAVRLFHNSQIRGTFHLTTSQICLWGPRVTLAKPKTLFNFNDRNFQPEWSVSSHDEIDYHCSFNILSDMTCEFPV